MGVLIAPREGAILLCVNMRQPIATKRDKEFCGRWSTYLEQSASLPNLNRNALASGVRSTSQDTPV